MSDLYAKMKKIHFLSGLTISIFVGLHLMNHLIGIFGAAAHVELMDKLRIIYRNPFSEFILLLAVGSQIITGLKLFLSKRKSAMGFYGKLQIWTGLYLAFFLVIHVSAVMVGRYILILDTNFYFGAAGLNSFPVNLFFIPYYGLSVVAFFGHLAAIHYQKKRKGTSEYLVQKQSRIILTIGVVISVLILFGMTGGFRSVEIPEGYRVLTGE